MRSPASGSVRALDEGAASATRLVLEWALRIAALLLVLTALWRETRPVLDSEIVRLAGDGKVQAALSAWSGDPAAANVHVLLEAPPADTVREWIAALRGAGVRASYEIPALPATAVAAEAVADPMRLVRLLAAAPAGEGIALGDAAGVLDTVRASGGGARLLTTAALGPLSASTGAVTARTTGVDSLLLRAVVVLGRAGWEAKFTIDALEERGWPVVARLVVAPGVVVSQRALPELDTAHVSAVVVLDSTAAPYAARAMRFVRQGGGLVLAGEGATLSAFASVAPARTAGFQPPSTEALTSADPRRGLPLRPLTAPRPEAVALERRGDLPAVVAWRVGAGRVVQVGYHESWRWRLAGPDGAPEQHREWWAGLLAAVAHAPPAVASPQTLPALDDAPVARLVATLGPPAGAPPLSAVAHAARTDWSTLLFILLATLLLAEWAARRLRGAP